MHASHPESPTNTPPEAAQTRPSRGPGRLGLSLLVLALIAGLLRFWRLGEWSLWVDEAYTYADARFGLDSDQIWNPLGYRLLMGVADMLGERPDEFGMRFLPALVGWFCIPLCWWAFRSWLGDRRAALVALLLAVCSWHIFWSQNARFYTMAMATSLVGSGLVLRALLGGRGPLALLGLLVTAAAAAFHVTAALLVPALCLGPWLGKFRGASEAPGARKVTRWLLVALLVGAAGGIPWLLPALDQHTAAKGTSQWLTGPVHFSLTLGYFFTPLLGAAALVGAIWSWMRRDAAGLLATTVCFVVLASLLLVSTQVLMTAQYAFCLLPWVLVLAVLPLESLGRCRKGLSLFLAGGFVLTAPALASTLLYFTARGGERPRWRDAYTFVDEQRAPGDLILGMGSEIGEFYLGADNPDPKSPRVVTPIGDWHTQGPSRWNRHDRRIWVVIRPQWLQALGPESEALFRTWLASDCRLVESFPLLMEGRDLELRVYLRE